MSHNIHQVFGMLPMSDSNWRKAVVSPKPYSLTNKMFTVLHRFSHVEMFVALSPSCITEGDQVLCSSQPYCVHPSPTENKLSRSHSRIGITVSIILCIISISKSMPLLNSRMDGCLIWHSKIYARMLWLLPTWLYMFQRSFSILIFRPCIDNKNCH